MNHRFTWATGASILGVLAITSLTFGCSRAPREIPEAPPDAIEAVVDGLSDNHPQVLWDALPASYQADIRLLITEFCTHMDTDTYDRTFGILAQAVRVMKEQKEFIFNSPIALSTPLLEASMGSQWNDAVRLLDTIATSELSTLESLGQMEPGRFLASTGHEVMETLESLRRRSQRSPTANRWEQVSRALKDSHIDFFTSTNGHGVLRFSSATNSTTRDVDLTEVEGRWVPADMAATWKERMEEAKANMARLSGPEFEEAKPMLSMALGTLEGATDSLLKAETQQEFDATLASLAALGGMLRAMKPSNR